MIGLWTIVPALPMEAFVSHCQLFTNAFIWTFICKPSSFAWCTLSKQSRTCGLNGSRWSVRCYFWMQKWMRAQPFHLCFVHSCAFFCRRPSFAQSFAAPGSDSGVDWMAADGPVGRHFWPAHGCTNRTDVFSHVFLKWLICTRGVFAGDHHLFHGMCWFKYSSIVCDSTRYFWAATMDHQMHADRWCRGMQAHFVTLATPLCLAIRFVILRLNSVRYCGSAQSVATVELYL